MVDYGQIIARLRKENNLTQSELGAKLNVTCQAVSKWENNQSQPDFGTMVQIADLFNVPLSIFKDNGATDATAATTVQQSNRIDEIVGYCKDCGNAVTEDNLAQQRPVLLCKTCMEQRKKAEQEAEAQRQAEVEKANREAKAKRITQYNNAMHARNKGFIWGSVAAAVALAVAIYLATLGELHIYIKIVPFVAVIGWFTFVSQLFWDGFVFETVLFGGKIVGMPGVIFSLDLDGIIFLVGAKILLALLKMLIFVATFLLGVVIAFVASYFTFIPALLRVNRGEL